MRVEDRRLRDHVDRLEQHHPPIDPATVDYGFQHPAAVRERFGGVLDYMARVELEVDRNVLELATLLPDAPDIDRRFYTDVWQPQETRHGLILDELQRRLGRPAAVADTTTVSAKIRVLGALAHLDPIHDVVRMLYYLTGMATERSAVLAYYHLHHGLLAMGERAVAETAVAPIRRQEPGHYAFYRISATALGDRLRPWQRWLVGQLRRLSFAPVGANDDTQKADFGGILTALGMRADLTGLAREISRVEQGLLWQRARGLEVPGYVLRALREAVELYDARARGSD